MTDESKLTIGDVIPSYMKSNYSSDVLNVTLKEARDIVKFDMPPSSDLSSDNVSALKEIYQEYETHNAYWNKKEEKKAKAFWSSN